MLLAASAVTRSTLRRLALTALAAATLGLSACGGGDRSVEYKPTAMLVFGDEHSAFVSVTVPGDGHPDKVIQPLTWGVDPVLRVPVRICPQGGVCDGTDDITEEGDFSPAEPQSITFEAGAPDLTSPPTIRVLQQGTFTYTPTGSQDPEPATRVFSFVYECDASPIWVKGVARSFGLGFGEQTGCAGDGAGATNYAQPGAKVADVIADLADNRGAMRDGVLVTVMVGQNDIVEQYNLVKDAGFTNDAIEDAESVLRERGLDLASAIKGVTGTGAKVILVKTPNLKRSPFAIAEGRGDVLDRLSEALNQAVYVNPEISRLGRSIAGVDTNEVVLANTTTSGYTNEVAACDAGALFDPADSTLVEDIDDMPRVCSTFTLKSGINPSAYVWATPRHLGPGAHSYIGSVAFNRAANQF